MWWAVARTQGRSHLNTIVSVVFVQMENISKILQHHGNFRVK